MPAESRRPFNAFWANYSVAKKYLDDHVENLAKDGQETIVRPYLGRIRLFSGEFGSRERRQAKATIHDAVYVEAPEEQEEQARHLTKTIMEKAVEMLLVPLEVEIG